jgi:hypothetical protein
MIIVLVVGLVLSLWVFSVFACDWIGARKGYPGGRGRFIAMGAFLGLLGVGVAAMMPDQHSRV